MARIWDATIHKSGSFSDSSKPTSQEYYLHQKFRKACRYWDETKQEFGTRSHVNFKRSHKKGKLKSYIRLRMTEMMMKKSLISE